MIICFVCFIWIFITLCIFREIGLLLKQYHTEHCAAFDETRFWYWTPATSVHLLAYGAVLLEKGSVECLVLQDKDMTNEAWIGAVWHYTVSDVDVCSIQTVCKTLFASIYLHPFIFIPFIASLHHARNDRIKPFIYQIMWISS